MAEKMTSLNAGRTMMERTKGYVDALIAEIASLIPTKTSELDNDAGFITAGEVPSGSAPEAITTEEIDALFYTAPSLGVFTFVLSSCYAKLYDDNGNEVTTDSYADGVVDLSTLAFVPTRMELWGKTERNGATSVYSWSVSESGVLSDFTKVTYRNTDYITCNILNPYASATITAEGGAAGAAN